MENERLKLRIPMWLRVLISSGFWKKILHCVIYASASAIVLNDLLLILGRTVSAKFLPNGNVIILDKLIQSIAGMFG